MFIRKLSRHVGQSFAVALLCATAVGISSCSTTKKTTETESVTPDSADADKNLQGDSDSGTNGMKTVNFPFDSFAIIPAEDAKVQYNADIMKGKDSVVVQIEGHCDERGGVQYNFALGEKRANAVKKRMVQLGITGERVKVISYGKERPLDPGHNEEAWAKNRRANFVITTN